MNDHADKCEHCEGDIKVRNPKGYCDHLQYPEYCQICRTLSKPKPNLKLHKHPLFKDYHEPEWIWIAGGEYLKNEMKEGTTDRYKIQRALAESGYTIIFDDKFFGIFRKPHEIITTETTQPTAGFKKGSPKKLKEIMEEMK